jgi:hypothetical protein
VRAIQPNKRHRSRVVFYSIAISASDEDVEFSRRGRGSLTIVRKSLTPITAPPAKQAHSTKNWNAFLM